MNSSAILHNIAQDNIEYLLRKMTQILHFFINLYIYDLKLNNILITESNLIMNKAERAFEIQKILDETVVDEKPHYLIKWKGYSSLESTWEPIENLLDALDLVHSWKVQKNPHLINRNPKTQTKTKKIHGKQREHREKLLQSQLNKELAVKKKKYKSKINCLSSGSQSSEDSVSFIPSKNNKIQHETSQYSFGEPESNQGNQRLRSAHKSTEGKKTVSNSLSKQKLINEEDLNGFKVVGKVTKQGIQEVLWCFDYDKQKICEVQLRDGRRVNMRREDVRRICPEKLLQYYEKIQSVRI